MERVSYRTDITRPGAHNSEQNLLINLPGTSTHGVFLIPLHSVKTVEKISNRSGITLPGAHNSTTSRQNLRIN